MWADLVGTLPVYDDEDNEIVWSEYGLTSVQATAALADLHVFGYSSTQALEDFIAATAAQMDPVQYRVPDPEP